MIVSFGTFEKVKRYNALKMAPILLPAAVSMLQSEVNSSAWSEGRLRVAPRF
jgi:hypothetical protein